MNIKEGRGKGEGDKRGGRGRGVRGGERRVGKGYEGEEGEKGIERGWRWVGGRVASLRGGGKWSSTKPQGPYLYS